jgi:hypothetical protein
VGARDNTLSPVCKYFQADRRLRLLDPAKTGDFSGFSVRLKLALSMLRIYSCEVFPHLQQLSF